MLIHSPVVRPPPVCFPCEFGVVVCSVDIGVVVCGAGSWPHPFTHAHFVVSVFDLIDLKEISKLFEH